MNNIKRIRYIVILIICIIVIVFNIKFIKETFSKISGKEGKINISAKMNKHDNQVEITFRDNGRGMSARMKNRIFSPGVTTKKRGWGLGLALVKRIVEDIHGGSIGVVSTHPGEGAVFLITLPVE